ncbi:hypothetical protein TorRG33x02_148530 [Trema orientale]|uniref:Uncharacterized protein n=1 Tax=Trema orientale TaxID=63057 RepID=A0A2P5EUT6_TREOI|nr:hypothetical protein TorRG33x02_148530 [Trema orientale]
MPTRWLVSTACCRRSSVSYHCPILSPVARKQSFRIFWPPLGFSLAGAPSDVLSWHQWHCWIRLIVTIIFRPVSAINLSPVRFSPFELFYQSL